MMPLGTRSSLRTESKVAAFFDLDNTLLPGEASEVRFFRALWRRKVVGWQELRASIWWLIQHTPQFSLQPLRERKLYLEGKPAQVIEPLGEEFCREELCPVVSADGMRKLEMHRQSGHPVMLITGSLDFLVQPIASALCVDRCVAAVLEQRDGVYTGRLMSPLPYGVGKRHLIQRLATELDLDLESCFAYGDSPGDLEILEAVGHPTVVNPIRGMESIAARKGWPVERWR